MTDVEQRLLARTVKNSITECWECNYATVRGQPVIKIKGMSHRCSRTAYQLWVGPITDGLHVCHSCDNPKCINPKHLWLGTNQENTADRHAKGRDSKVGNRGNVKGDLNGSRKHPESLNPCKGSAHGRAKLTDEQVKYIRMWAKEGFLQSQIAKAFSITQPHVSDIVNGKNWAHII